MDSTVIVIPSFNSKATIARTLNSLQDEAAALSRISAVYLADDCSQDETVLSAKAHWRAATPLYVLKGERNLGERGNVNRAIEVLGNSVEWLLLLHSDDIAKPHWLSVMLSRIEACAESVASICSSWDTLMPDGYIVPGENNPHSSVEIIKGTVEAVRGTLERGCWWHISGCAIRVSAFKDIGGFHPNLPQLGDWEWLLRCLKRGWGVEYVPLCLIQYRQHAASVSSASFMQDRDIVESLEIVRRYADLLSKKDLSYFHLRRGIYVSRRFGRAMTQLRLQRCLSELKTMAMIGLNLSKSLRERLRID